jgi:acetyl-CoA carboxylase beta subunit
MEKIKCKNCNNDVENEIFILNLWVCPYCNHHYTIGARDRLQITADSNSFNELGKNISSIDFLNFYDVKSYSERLKETRLKASLDDAIIIGDAQIEGNDIALGIMDFGFMGGSMGSVVGEKIKQSQYRKKYPSHYILYIRRSQNAGRCDITDADGKDCIQCGQGKGKQDSLYNSNN